MAYSSFRIGDRVQPANPARMLRVCDTYHSGVTHGEVVDIMPEYAESVIVRWHYSDGTAGAVTYSLLPFDLLHGDGHSGHTVRITVNGAVRGYRHRAECECGWNSVGYASVGAATDMGRWHVESGGVLVGPAGKRSS